MASRQVPYCSIEVEDITDYSVKRRACSDRIRVGTEPDVCHHRVWEHGPEKNAVGKSGCVQCDCTYVPAPEILNPPKKVRWREVGPWREGEGPVERIRSSAG